MPHSENNNLIFFDIEYYTIIAYSKPVASQDRISQSFSMFERIFAIPEECFADPLPNRGGERFDVSLRSPGIDESIGHRPKSSSCVFTRFPL